ncbi:MAG: hypothetical protein CM15mP103_04690 [Gammaproteobacteria bacterium]|nr:MAG: hypothetical protein CM15mP103_04690 [Gammaproteobacteria bacterium]
MVWFACADDQLDDVFPYGRRHMDVQHRFRAEKISACETVPSGRLWVPPASLRAKRRMACSAPCIRGRTRGNTQEIDPAGPLGGENPPARLGSGSPSPPKQPGSSRFDCQCLPDVRALASSRRVLLWRGPRGGFLPRARPKLLKIGALFETQKRLFLRAKDVGTRKVPGNRSG